jgi:predicted XRE-type DNA-binding protein
MDNKEKNIKKQYNKTVDLIVKRTKDALGKDITLLAEGLGVNLEHIVRFTFIARICKDAREQKKISIKEISKSLNVPQYTIKNIEENKVPDISISALKHYVDLLGLNEVFEKWKKENLEVIKSFKP